MGIELKADGVTGASQGAMSCQQGQETRSVVERIAAFAGAARPERLTPEIRRLFKRNILDSLACAIAALPGRPFAALREQFEEYRAPGRCTLIGGGKTALPGNAEETVEVPDLIRSAVIQRGETMQ